MFYFLFLSFFVKKAEKKKVAKKKREKNFIKLKFLCKYFFLYIAETFYFSL